jgi:hypothetical protein
LGPSRRGGPRQPTPHRVFRPRVASPGLMNIHSAAR